MVFVYSKLRLKSFSTYVVWPLTLNTKPIAKIRSFTCQNSVLDFFNPSSGTRESPPVLLDTEHEEPDDLAQVKRRSFPLQTAICPVSYFCIFFSWSKYIVWNHLRYLNILFMEKSLSTNGARICTRHDVTSVMWLYFFTWKLTRLQGSQDQILWTEWHHKLLYKSTRKTFLPTSIQKKTGGWGTLCHWGGHHKAILFNRVQSVTTWPTREPVRREWQSRHLLVVPKWGIARDLGKVTPSVNVLFFVFRM